MGSDESGRWTDGGAYERYVGRWSRKVASKFVAWLSPEAGLSWLDAGCGTGALTSTVLDTAKPRAVFGIDTSASFIAIASSSIQDERARFEVADIQAIPQEEQSVDWAVSGLCLNHVPEPPKALAEMARVTRSGGVVAAYVWDYGGEMQMLRSFWDAAMRVDPAAAGHDQGKANPLCGPDPLRALFEDAGLKAVDVVGIQIDTVFANFSDYWKPFEGGTGTAPAYVQGLPLLQRATLESELRRALPVEGDGSIHLTARAWGVLGRR